MSNYNSIKSIFQAKSYQMQMFCGFDVKNIRPITIMINYMFNSIDLSFFNQYYKSDKVTGGRPNIDFKVLLKLFTLATYDSISIRNMIDQINRIDSDYSYLAQELKSPPSKSIVSKFYSILDKHIDDIFAQTIEVFSSELELNFKTLFCDGTVFEAHNNRHKIIRIGNIKKSDEKWLKVLRDSEVTNEEKGKAEAKLAINIKRREKLALLERSSYGVTDEDSALLKDKNGSFIAGYNVQFVVEGKHGLIVYTYISNYGNDCTAFLKMVDGLIEATKPTTIVMDAGYGTEDIIVALYNHETISITKPYKTPKNDGSINIYDFILSIDGSFLICPEGRVFKNTSRQETEEVSFLTKGCENCNRFSECSKLKKRNSFRIIIIKHLAIQKARLDALSKESIELYSKRINLCESPHGFMKYCLNGKKLKMNGLNRNNTVSKIYAILYNLTRYNTIRFGEKK